MKTEFTINPHTGEMVVRRADEALLTGLQLCLGPGEDSECGQSLSVAGILKRAGSVRIASIVHGSMVNGPGLRSVAFFQGCSRLCGGCISPHTHPFDVGIGMSVSDVTVELLRTDIPRDGVTLSGGDPLVQPDACAEIVARVKQANVHVVLYTGFTFEQLLAADVSSIRKVLDLADVLIDGPFVAGLRDESLSYRGSSNQRVIDLLGTRQTGRLCLLDWD